MCMRVCRLCVCACMCVHVCVCRCVCVHVCMCVDHKEDFGKKLKCRVKF